MADDENLLQLFLASLDSKEVERRILLLNQKESSLWWKI